MVDNSIVVKFGGSCLKNPSQIFTAAKKIAVEVSKGKKILVVVSAMKGVTDELLDLAKKSTSNTIIQEDLDEILSMGERNAVLLMTTALKSLGLKAVAINPHSSLWPIYTDSHYGNAEVDLKKTEKAITSKLHPLIQTHKIPVVAGFLGLSSEGKITTLGRGGSDISAVIIGRLLNSEEVIFVKDVEGIFSADPKKIVKPKKIDSLKVEEVYTLASAGAKVIHPKALRYKKNSMNLRVVGFNSQDLGGGTLITGELKKDLKIKSYSSPISMITVIVPIGSSIKVLSKCILKASSLNAKVLGVALATNSILIYVENPSKLVTSYHNLIKKRGLAKAIHCIDSLAMIEISGYNLEEIPGIMDFIVSPLAKENINLYGVLTISSSIKIFVPWIQKNKAISLINNSLTSFKKWRKNHT